MIFGSTIKGAFFLFIINKMDRKDLIKKIVELSQNAYKKYSRSWDEESLDAYAYLDWLEFWKLKDEELFKIVEEYSRCSEDI